MGIKKRQQHDAGRFPLIQHLGKIEALGTTQVVGSRAHQRYGHPHSRTRSPCDFETFQRRTNQIQFWEVRLTP